MTTLTNTDKTTTDTHILSVQQLACINHAPLDEVFFSLQKLPTKPFDSKEVNREMALKERVSSQPMPAEALSSQVLNGNWLNANWLNANLDTYRAVKSLADNKDNNDTPTIDQQRVKFKCQSSYANDDRYYEQIIHDDGDIPTRSGSWHDFFNAVIWSRYPQTKRLLNAMHVEEISRHGLHPRSTVRNKLTLFDECGSIIITQHKNLKTAFADQDWNTVFRDPSMHWFSETLPFIFGHAIYEMLLNPFIGLTGKVLIIEVAEIPNELCHQMQNTDKFGDHGNIDGHAAYQYLDALLANHLVSNKVFEHTKPFYPFPLLGVPGWYIGEQDEKFYANQQYFMPKRA